jgi:DNA-binding HxlR family transcriptional regulator
MPRKPMKQEILFRILPSDGSSKRWKELAVEAKKEGLGHAWLKKLLDKYVEQGIVERTIDTSEYPPPVFYRLTKNHAELLSNYRKSMDDIDIYLDKIVTIKNKAKREKALAYFLVNQLASMSAFIATSFRYGLDKPRIEEVYELVDILLYSYLRPWLQLISHLYIENKDIAEKAARSAAMSLSSMSNSTLKSFKNILL